MISLTIVFKGEAPLVMHNVRMADPLDEFTKRLRAVTAKRKKTEADHEDIARIEFEGGLYFDPELGPYLPAENIYKCLVEGARLTKQGRAVERAVVISDLMAPLIYDGPRTVDGLYGAGFVYRAPVGVGTSRTIRTRPRFDRWTVGISAFLDEEMLNADEFDEIAVKAGRYIGIGERRPMFGRFHAIVERGGPNGQITVPAERLAAEVAAAV